MRASIHHIWFDLAGTLYEETPKFNKVHDQFRFETYAKLQNITDLKQAEREFLELYQKHGSNSAVFRALGQPSSYWMKALDNMDFTAVLNPNPEISETLAKLKNEVPISLFTNFVRHRIGGLLNHLEISPDDFTHILTGDDITERKPHLEGFYKMVKLSGLPANQILYIGDRLEVDVKPAKAVGMQTGLLYGKSDEADYSFESFKDILGVI